MAQHDYVIANGTGAAVRSDLNNGLSAIVTQNSGATEPATTYAFMRWADTTAGVMKMRNSANNAWITLYQLDGEWTNIAFENGTAAAPSIYFKDSGTDTGFYSPGANQVGISTGGTARLTIDSNGNVDIDSNTLYVDATNNRVGLGTSTVNAGAALHIARNTNGNTATLRMSGNDGVGDGGAGIVFADNETVKWSLFTRRYSSNNRLYISTAENDTASAKVTITEGGAVGIGTTAAPGKLTVSTTSANPSAGLSAWSDGYSVVSPGGTSASGGIGLSFDTSGNTGSLSCATPGSAWRDIIYTANSHRFNQGASEFARIDSSGRLLVGTSTAGSNYRVGTSSFTPILQVEGTSPNVSPLGIKRTDGAPYFYIATGASVSSGSQVGYISFNANDGTNLVQAASIGAEVDGTPGTNDMPGRLVFSTTADGASSPTERMRISRDGLVTIGSTTAVSNERTFGVQGAETSGGVAVAHFRNTSSDAAADTSPVLALSKTRTTTSSSARFIQFYADNGVTPMGGIVGNGANNVQFATLSDVRDKENIQPLIGSLSKIKELQVVSYDWKANGEHIKAGFIAQNVETVFPEYIVENMASDGEEARKGITGGLSSGYVAVLTAALQEAIAKIEALEAEVAALKGA